ncbi:MAG: sugar phosphate isomerase/epimerase [Oscillospiraceae bacterium]|nr:sugar phosphate isomerase/epimerase [Oscillospiraceae bacterium]
MRYCFSTVGCPDWSWGEIVAAARDLGYDGIELRGLGKELFTPDAAPFRPGQVSQTIDDLKAKGLAIACVSSDVLLHSAEGDQLGRAAAYIALAAALGAPYVRVLGDDWGQPGQNVDEARVRERLCALSPLAGQAGVVLLVETNGVWADTGKLRRLLEDVASPHVAVLWDINHPARYFGESPRTTWGNLGALVKHVHLKDSALVDGTLVYKMLGHGDLPIGEVLSLLKGGGFAGVLSMEWVKRWNADLEDAGVVFPHFIYKAKKMWQQA